ncbi:hypothetical protein APR04_001690 [Promicromonospora umidemergens]|uniref:Uncharacterized protein n=1 Tax=Promicromonospora umidemergens TaxID=629679 RepID=A0ABP8XHG3_9MICO|nr:hypothetical protein [Promicromonospora umidemergens]MCP2282787.1 hypothetical protein [Promicromonospora umidemergens]
MSGVRPTALAYVAGPTEQALDDQRNVLSAYAAVEGLALEPDLADPSDTLTISQVVAAVRACRTRIVLIAAGARMAEAQARVTHDLKPYGAVCVVIGRSHPAVPRRAGRLANDPSPASARRAGMSIPPTPGRGHDNDV